MLMPTAWHAIGIQCCALRLKFMGEYFSADGKPQKTTVRTEDVDLTDTFVDLHKRSSPRDKDRKM